MGKKNINKIKKQIINSLEDNRARVLNIEISRSQNIENKWNIRIGDILGSTEMSNIEIEKVLDEIKDEMISLKK